MGLAQAKVNITRPAGEDLRGKQNLLVGFDGKLGTAGAIAFPLENDNASPGTEPCALAISGEAPVIFGGVVAVGDALQCSAGGKAVKAATEGASVIGYALTTGADGETGSMLVYLNGVVPAA